MHKARPSLTFSAALSLALTLVPILSFTTHASAAQVYKVTDDENGVVFTDRPENVSGSSSVERVEIREPNTTTPPPAVSTARPSARETTSEAPPEPKVTITSPSDESTIAMGPGNFSVSVQVSPPLSGNEELVLMMDGQAMGAAQAGTSWLVEGALRGPHDLVVQRRSTSGRSIAVSEPVRVYVLRPSVR